MTKVGWGDLLARFPEPHVVLATLPDLSEDESMSNARSAQRLLVRLIRKLGIRGEFAVTVSRQSGRREIVCAFGASVDAEMVAKAARAIKQPTSVRVRYSFALDVKSERNLAKIAGPPQPNRHPKATLRFAPPLEG